MMLKIADITDSQFESITGQPAAGEASAVTRMPPGSAARLTRTAAGYGATARVTLRTLSKRAARLLYMDPIRAGEEFSLTLFRREGGEVALRCVVTHCDRDGGDAGTYAIEARFVRCLSDTGPALPAHDAAEIERIRMAVFG
jgi:hypothetical protein